MKRWASLFGCAGWLTCICFVSPYVCSAEKQESNIKASWYSEASLKKEGTWKTSKGRMANGKMFDENKNTCATRMYPIGTILKITNKKTRKSVIVKVTDRIGKRFANTRIDLSKRAFETIGDLKQGLIPIIVEIYH